MKDRSLTIVGSGIKFLSQLTQEAIVYIKKSDRILYLVNDPALIVWIKNQNPNSESLHDLYFKFEKRIDSYNAITKYIIDSMEECNHLCVVVYGHPTIFSKPALDAVLFARQANINAKALPAVSAEDCLFADLLIDPGSVGCQSFEATDFLIRSRKFDSNSHLVLWQPDVIGVECHATESNQIGLQLLCEHLSKFYPINHEIVIYTAAQYPGMLPIINCVTLKDLANEKLSQLSTLYVKPLSKAELNQDYLKRLNVG